MNMWLVGAGYWGSKLLDNLKKFGVEAQVIDIRNGQTIDDINTLDPVMLATPLWQHREQAIELLQRGHDVYVEKPLAETYQEAVEIGNCVKPGQLLMVGHLFVHHPQLAEIKSIIARGDIGKVNHINSRRLNWGIYQTKTDPLLSLATHDISIVQELIGTNLIPTSAHAWNYSENVQQDRIWFAGRNDSNITFEIDVSWHWPVRTRQTIVFGDQGQIIWDQDANTITIADNHIANNRAVTGSTKIIPYNHSLSPLETELVHWIDCLKTRTNPSTGIKSAKDVATTIDLVKRILL